MRQTISDDRDHSSGRPSLCHGLLSGPDHPLPAAHTPALALSLPPSPGPSHGCLADDRGSDLDRPCLDRPCFCPGRHHAGPSALDPCPGRGPGRYHGRSHGQGWRAARDALGRVGLPRMRSVLGSGRGGAASVSVIAVAGWRRRRRVGLSRGCPRPRHCQPNQERSGEEVRKVMSMSEQNAYSQQTSAVNRQKKSRQGRVSGENN